MNRRCFLSTLLGTAGAIKLDPERLLWRPDAKLISIPKATTLTAYRYKLGDTILVRPPIQFHPHAFVLTWPLLEPLVPLNLTDPEMVRAANREDAGSLFYDYCCGTGTGILKATIKS